MNKIINTDGLISKQMALDEIDQMPIMTDMDGVKYIEKTCLKIRINLLHPMGVRHGYWIEIPDDWEYQCSECGHLSSYQTVYCSAYGADMKENDENH